MRKKILFSCGIMFLMISCMNPEKLLKNTSAERLYFGKSGGFTNIPMAYVLIDHSIIFKIDQDTYTAVKKLKKTQIRQLHDMMNEIHLETLQLNEPGNMTYYLKISKTGLENEVKWTDNSKNESVRKIYNTLLSFINQ